MTMYRRQAIPLHQWGYHVNTIVQRDAIVGIMPGAFVFVDDTDELYQWDGVAFELIQTGGGGGSSSPDVLIDCGTIVAPSDNVLIDCGTII